MHTSINDRRKGALTRLEAQLKKVPVENKDIKDRISNEMKILTDRMNGVKKALKKQPEPGKNISKDKWLIDIYTVNYGYVKNSVRRKKENKGKSKKKMKKVKTTTFVKTVINQPGMIQSFKEGRMGLSPKTHVFKLRQDIPQYY